MVDTQVLLFLIGIIVIIIISMLLMSSVKLVQPFQIGLLFVSGNFKHKLIPGINLVPPLISKVKMIDLRLKPYVINTGVLKTFDNRDFYREVIVYAKVTDPEKAYFNIKDYKSEILAISERVIKKEVRKIKYMEIDFDM